MTQLTPRQYDQNLLAHGIVRPLAPDEAAVLESALARSGVKINRRDAKRLEPIGEPEWNDDEVTPMQTQLPDSLLQSALYGRLMAAGLSAASAVLLALDQAQAALAAGLAIVAAAAAATSKVREMLRARQ